MCLHASWMLTEHCTRCTPLPKVERPAPKPKRERRPAHMGARHARRTDEFLIDDALMDMLCDGSSDGETLRAMLRSETLPASNSPCIFYRPTRGETLERMIPIRLIVDGTEVVTSAARAVYAASAANRDRVLAEGQPIVHLCQGELHEDIRLCCINPAHIAGSKFKQPCSETAEHPS